MISNLIASIEVIRDIGQLQTHKLENEDRMVCKIKARVASALPWLHQVEPSLLYLSLP